MDPENENPHYSLADRLKEGYQDLFRETPIEIAIGAIVGAVLASAGSCHYEQVRDANIPLAYSEKRQLEKDAEEKGQQLGPMTSYLTSVNDAVMKIFEAHNAASAPGFLRDHDQLFAEELKDAFDPSVRLHHYSLADLLQAIPGQSQAVVEELREFVEIRDALSGVIAAFDQAWDEDHDHHYKTIFVTVCHTSGKGRTSCHPSPRRVYDYTIHTFTYHPEAGERASSTLSALMAAHPALEFTETLPDPSKTNVEGEEAAAKTHESREKGKAPDPSQYLTWATTWRRGSTLKVTLPEVYDNWGGLRSDDPQWQQAAQTAASKRYRTNSHSDSGPREFQVAERAEQHARGMQKSISEIVHSISSTPGQAATLNSFIGTYLGVVQEGKPGDAPELRSQIMDTARAMYHQNFKAGEDVNGFRWWVVLLFTFGGAALGGLLGYAWDQVGTNLGWYDGSRWERR